MTANTYPSRPAVAFVVADKNGQQLVIGDGATLDCVQESGEWVATRDPIDLEGMA